MAEITAVAYVNHGRWVADCPFCPGAERVWPDLRLHASPLVPYRFGITDSRLHCGFTGQTAPVVFPADAPKIIRLLSRRPLEHQRNWKPGETVADIAAENLQHGAAI